VFSSEYSDKPGPPRLGIIWQNANFIRAFREITPLFDAENGLIPKLSGAFWPLRA
jgi:hypothetical protein